jgi:hypothetical protein
MPTILRNSPIPAAMASNTGVGDVVANGAFVDVAQCADSRERHIIAKNPMTASIRAQARSRRAHTTSCTCPLHLCALHRTNRSGAGNLGHDKLKRHHGLLSTSQFGPERQGQSPASSVRSCELMVAAATNPGLVAPVTRGRNPRVALIWRRLVQLITQELALPLVLTRIQFHPSGADVCSVSV